MQHTNCSMHGSCIASLIVKGQGICIILPDKPEHCRIRARARASPTIKDAMPAGPMLQFVCCNQFKQQNGVAPMSVSGIAFIYCRCIVVNVYLNRVNLKSLESEKLEVGVTPL